MSQLGFIKKALQQEEWLQQTDKKDCAIQE